jgi:hypothetical protein
VSCAHCGKPIEPNERVVLNGAPYHVKDCFAAGLRSKTFKLEELAVLFDESVPPMEAYRAGKQTVATIVAARRRTKKRGAL